MASSSDAGSEEEMTLGLKWAGKDFTVRVCADDTVGELKRRICELTNVLPKRQKLLNLKLGAKPAPDSSLLSSVTLKPGVKISMMGTVEDEIFVDPVDSPEILDDFELGEEDTVDIKDADVNKAKLRRRVDNFKLTFLNPPRSGKKLLVLDIDYTLFDHRSTAENPKELMRPYLHEFLSASYSAYDIIIWSATSMKWVEVKMKELGVLNNPNYKITALMDHLAMITVQSPTHGVFDCKPLGVIWAKCPEVLKYDHPFQFKSLSTWERTMDQSSVKLVFLTVSPNSALQFYNPSNTIMFDDLKRNFVMNPQNGLVIKPFRKAHLNRATDNELIGLAEYLLAIAERDSLSGLDHRRWHDYAGHQQWKQ